MIASKLYLGFKSKNSYYSANDNSIYDELAGKLKSQTSAPISSLLFILKSIFMENLQNEKLYKHLTSIIEQYRNFNTLQKVLKYRLGRGIYFVCDNKYFAIRYAFANKKADEKSYILELSLIESIEDSNNKFCRKYGPQSISDSTNELKLINFLDGDLQLEFFNFVKQLRDSLILEEYIKYICFYFNIDVDRKNLVFFLQNILKDINLDGLIVDLMYELNYKEKIHGYIISYNDYMINNYYSNIIFHIKDDKSFRQISGITPQHHTEVVLKNNDGLKLLLGQTAKVLYLEHDIESTFLNKLDGQFKKLYGLEL